MPNETPVTVKYESHSLYEALTAELGDLANRPFNRSNDEVRVSVDPGGSGRLGVTLVFELDAEQLRRVLDAAAVIQ